MFYCTETSSCSGYINNLFRYFATPGHGAINTVFERSVVKLPVLNWNLPD